MVWIIARIWRESKDKYVDVIKMTQYSILFLLSLNDASINIISIWIEMSSTFISTVGNILVSMVLYIPLTQLSWLIMLKHMNSTRLSLNKVDYKYIKRMIKIYEIKLILVIILFYFLFISIITVSYYLMVQHGIQNTVGKFMFYSQIAAIYLIFAVSGVIIQRKITITLKSYINMYFRNNRK